MMLMLLLLLLIFTFPYKIQSARSDINVVVVGAGAAGIAAATRLYQNGIENVTILEAENRIGGRIFTVKFADAYVDLGAQWCAGEKNNVVYELVKNLNLLRPDDVNVPQIYHSQEKLLDKEFTQQVTEIYKSLDQQDSNRKNASLGEYLIKRFTESVAKKWGKNPDKLNLAHQFLGLLEKWALTLESASSWFDVAADSDHKTYEGNQYLNWNGLGYKTILDVLMHNYPDSSNIPIPIEDQILLNKEVSEILWDERKHNTQKVLVNCADGSKYSADHVIVTTSLGVLKSSSETMFKPPLPVDKINAIEEIGYGDIIKLFLHFPNRWWKENDFGAFSFIWDEADLAKAATAFPQGPNTGGRSWISSISLVDQVYPVAKYPNVLLVFFSGEAAQKIEQCSDETIINGIMYTLNEFLGPHYTNISRPDNITRNNWYHNPHFRGTNSYPTLKSVGGAIPKPAILSQPLSTKDGKQVLLFAGEATNPSHYSTVHGAIESGFREADRLIALYK